MIYIPLLVWFRSETPFTLVLKYVLSDLDDEWTAINLSVNKYQDTFNKFAQATCWGGLGRI